MQCHRLPSYRQGSADRTSPENYNRKTFLEIIRSVTTLIDEDAAAVCDSAVNWLLLAARPARKMPEPHRTWLYRYLPRTSPFDVCVRRRCEKVCRVLLQRQRRKLQQILFQGAMRGNMP
ncbi:hypothetical protein RB195_017922 [Necator americanus]|uniref:BACK domain-containing protein n=1 Tax=Necator americanus TaxID=51031 RepID=A0ABR1CAZ9_NECAM